MQNLIGHYVTANYKCIGKLLEYDASYGIFYVEDFDGSTYGWSFPANRKPLKKSTKGEIEMSNTTQKQCTKAIVSLGAKIEAAEKFVEKTFGFLQERGLSQHEANAEMQKYIQSFA